MKRQAWERRDWRPTVRYHIAMIEMSLGDCERGYDHTGNIQYHLDALKLILPGVPEEEKLSANVWLQEQLKKAGLSEAKK